jgi:spermidine/putrescine transport system ATP-binding protein
MTAEAMIEIENLSRRFGQFTALDGVSLTIRKGEFFSLLGPSGCGKTTLLRLIGGLDEPSSGSIRIAGQDMTGIPANLRPTNMVFQSYAIFPHLNVRDNVGYGLKRLRLGRAEEERQIAEALELVELVGLGPRMGHQLSGGQRQRVALARALVLRPKVLLLDEPLSALDKKLREQMQVELRKLQRAVGITFVLVTHDQYEALAMSDRIAVMFDGRIAQVDAPQAMYQRPVDRAVADFLGGMNFLTTRGAARLAGNEIVAEAPGFGRISARIPEGAALDPADAIFGLRPERLRIVWDDGQPAQLSAKVVDRHYFGEVTHLIVRVEGQDEELAVVEANDFGADDIAVGLTVRLAYDPGAFIAMAPEPATARGSRKSRRAAAQGQ